MIARLSTVWYAVRSSLWALPLAMVLAAAALAYITLQVRLDLGSEPVWFLFSGSGSQAPQFLSSLMTAMITMATLAISITMVVLTLAAQQLGPRLIRNFMASRRTQASLGLFVGTVVYLLLVLRSAYGDRNSVPNLAVTGGTLLVLICVITLLLFVHHLARSIVADNIIDEVGQELDGSIGRLLPDKDAQRLPAPKPDKDAEPVSLPTGGYVQAIDYKRIVRAAAEADATVEVLVRAGHHMIAGAFAATISPADRADDALCQAIRGAVVLGAERTTVQDLEYSVRQMVEVALRALSPGINDVYTALAVINRLTLSIRNMMARGAPQSVWCDADGTARLLVAVSTFEGVADAAFNQIRQAGFGTPAVLIHLADSLGQLLQQADAEHRPALEKHLALVLAAGRRTIEDEADLKVLESRARHAKDEAGAEATGG